MDRKVKWEFIKTKLPDVAVFMTMINKGFGKPKAVAVMYEGKIILHHGEFDKPKKVEPSQYMKRRY